MEDSSREVAKRLSGKIELGDMILAEGELKDIKTNGFYNMPCPGSAPHGMSIFGKDEDSCYVEAFCDGTNVEFFTGAEDKIVVKYGGKIGLEYRVTEEALEEYGVALEDYEHFVEKLRGMGLDVQIKPGAEGNDIS